MGHLVGYSQVLWSSALAMEHRSGRSNRCQETMSGWSTGILAVTVMERRKEAPSWDTLLCVTSQRLCLTVRRLVK